VDDGILAELFAPPITNIKNYHCPDPVNVS